MLSLFDKVVGQEVVSYLITDAALHDPARDRGERDWAVITGLTFRPFLKIGVTLANLQSAGTLPSAKDMLYSSDRATGIVAELLFRKSVVRPSGPGADPDLKGH